jgi:hypothetical protein
MLSYIGAAVALWIAVDIVILLLIGASPRSVERDDDPNIR